MERLRRLVYDHCLVPVGRSLVTYGSYWVHIPPVEPNHEPGPVPDGARTSGPAPGHPERLRPDLPLTALERELARSLGAPR